MENYKLHIKVGPHEFQGEGPEDTVKKNFEDWKSMIASITVMENVKSASGQSPVGGNVSAPLDGPHASRLFLLDDKKGLVTLRVLPRGEDRLPDAALLILLGFRQLKDQDEVLVTQLKPALKQSGCGDKRVDSVVGKYLRDGLINKGGIAKGGRYSLTNSGIEKATSLARGLVS
ncbi:MAG: hypothetical protein ACRD23_07685 [Terriglobales bacterium]